MREYIIQGETLTSIAEAIRAKTGTTELLTPNEMITAIQNSGGGSDTEMLIALVRRNASDIVIPEGAKVIGIYAFYNYSNLKSLFIPDTIIEIASSAFYGCVNLNLTSLPNGITNIGSYAFLNCKALELTSLPESLRSIGGYAFKGCIGLKSISIPETVNTVNIGAFESCTGLETVTFKKAPTTLNGGAFNLCTNLKTIKVPWAEGEVANAPWGATNATIIYNWNPIFEETITFGAYEEDWDGHHGTFTDDSNFDFESETVYRVFINDVEYEGSGWKDEWATGIEVDMGNMFFALTMDFESGTKDAVYMYNETPESTEDLPESLTFDITILKN